MTLYKLIKNCLKKEVRIDKRIFAFVSSFIFLGYAIGKYFYATYIHNATQVKTITYKWFELHEEVIGEYIPPMTFSAGDAFIIFMGIGFLFLFISKSSGD